MTSIIKIGFKMASIQNEENTSKELDFKTQTEDGKSRNPTIKEEFVKVIKEYFSKTSGVARVHGCLKIM